MKSETADYLDKARTCLADARQIATVPLPRLAAREAYYAAFHAAEAYIFEHTGKVAITHRGVRAEFARVARREPRIDRELSAFLQLPTGSRRRPTMVSARPSRRSPTTKRRQPSPRRVASSLSNNGFWGSALGRTVQLAGALMARFA